MEQQFLINMSQDEFFERLKECFAEALFAPEPNEGVKVKKHYVYGLICLDVARQLLHVLKEVA